MTNEEIMEFLEPYKAVISELLDDYGFEHSLNVASTARLLATLYGVDEREALLGGLLHDWDRCVPNDQIVPKAKKFGIQLDEVLLANPHLLHAHTGAHSAREYFAASDSFEPLSDAVVGAIANHTVGRPHMSDLEMIVYIADMIEPTRKGDYADPLREMVGTVGLTALFKQCYQATMTFLVKNRMLIHPDTFRVWNAYMLDENQRRKEGNASW